MNVTPSLSETIIDHWINQAVKHYGKSDVELKMHSIYAAPVVGKYQLGGTQAIAKGIKRSPSAVENYAHAFWLYDELRRTEVRNRVRTLWRVLPVSHWYQAWTIHKAGYNAFYYLNNAELHKESGREMMDSYKKDLEAGNAPLIFKRGVIALRGLVNELLNKYNNQLSEGQKIALLSIIDNFEVTE